MQRLLIAVLVGIVALPVAAFVGYYGGALAGTYLACYILMPESNLCGLLGVFITGPLGLVVAVGLAAKFLWDRCGAGADGPDPNRRGQDRAAHPPEQP